MKTKQEIKLGKRTKPKVNEKKKTKNTPSYLVNVKEEEDYRKLLYLKRDS